MRGELKNAARPLAKAYYHFIRRKSYEKKNAKLVRDLFEGDAFVYEVSYAP